MSKVSKLSFKIDSSPKPDCKDPSTLNRVEREICEKILDAIRRANEESNKDDDCPVNFGVVREYLPPPDSLLKVELTRSPNTFVYIKANANQGGVCCATPPIGARIEFRCGVVTAVYKNLQELF